MTQESPPRRVAVIGSTSVRSEGNSFSFRAIFGGEGPLSRFYVRVVPYFSRETTVSPLWTFAYSVQRRVTMMERDLGREVTEQKVGLVSLGTSPISFLGKRHFWRRVTSYHRVGSDLQLVQGAASVGMAF